MMIRTALLVACLCTAAPAVDTALAAPTLAPSPVAAAVADVTFGTATITSAPTPGMVGLTFNAAWGTDDNGNSAIVVEVSPGNWVAAPAAIDGNVAVSGGFTFDLSPS